MKGREGFTHNEEEGRGSLLMKGREGFTHNEGGGGVHS